MTATIPGTIGSTLDIPDLPDRARMYRDCGERLRDAMRDKGIAALVLLGNGNVVYATGVSWPLLDAGARLFHWSWSDYRCMVRNHIFEAQNTGVP